MKPRVILAGLIVAAAGVFIVSQTISQESKAPTQEDIIAAWAKYAQPGEFHKNLEPLVGSWDFQTKWWAEPDAPPQESEGRSEGKWILGGRFIMENITGEMSGSQFHGMGIVGYDNYKQEYVYFWIDEMATSFMLSTGQADESGRVITFEGTFDDPVTGQKDKKFKSIFRILSNDRHIHESYSIGPDGKEFKSFEVTCTRKK